MKWLPVTFLATVLFAVNGAATADDVLVVGSLDFSYKELTLTPGSGTPFTTTLSNINPAATIAYKGFYASLGYDRSLGSQTTTEIRDNGLANSIDMSRSDIVFTLGYRVFDFLNVFAGWLHGDTAAHTQGLRNENFGGPDVLVYSIQDISYIEQGPFAGVSLSHTFGNKGSLSFSVAYAALNGELTTSNSYVEVLLAPGAGSHFDYFVAQADVQGLSYSLVWTGTLTGSMNYRVGAKYTSYRGDSIANESGRIDEGIKEKYTTFFVGLSNYF